MKKRMHLKKKRKKVKFLIFILIFEFILLLLAFLKYINIKPLIINYSEMEANKLATLIINTVLTEENDLKKEQLYEINNNIINYDTVKINKILTNLTSRIQYYFQIIESLKNDDKKNNFRNSEIIKKRAKLYIPMGYLTGSSFLANTGPKIPLKIKLIGDVKTDIKSTVTDYGLNNALLKIYIYVEVVTQSVIPLISNIQKTVVEYPLVLKVIEGKVPTYYIAN